MIPMSDSAFRWPLFALFSLLVAAVIAFLATQMVSQRIGIASEPVSAGEQLTPKTAPTAGRKDAAATPPVPGPAASGTQPGAEGAASEGSDGSGSSSGGNQVAGSGDDGREDD